MGTVGTWSLGSVNLGQVTQEESVKDAQLFQQPIPLSDSSAAIMLDLFGASRTITVTGSMTGTQSAMATATAALDAMINGNQSTQVYNSGTTGLTYNVLVETIDWKSMGGEPTHVDYTLTLYEGQE